MMLPTALLTVVVVGLQLGILDVPAARGQNLVVSPSVVRVSTRAASSTITPAPKNDISLIEGRGYCESKYLFSTFSTVLVMQGCSPERLACCPLPTTRANRQYFNLCPADYEVRDQYSSGVIQCCPKGYSLVGISISNPAALMTICQTDLATLTESFTTPASFWFPDRMASDTGHMYALPMYARTVSGNTMSLPTSLSTAVSGAGTQESGQCTGGGSSANTEGAETTYTSRTLAGAIVGSAVGSSLLAAGAAILCYRRAHRGRRPYDTSIPVAVIEPKPDGSESEGGYYNNYAGSAAYTNQTASPGYPSSPSHAGSGSHLAPASQPVEMDITRREMQ